MNKELMMQATITEKDLIQLTNILSKHPEQRQVGTVHGFIVAVLSSLGIIKTEQWMEHTVPQQLSACTGSLNLQNNLLVSLPRNFRNLTSLKSCYFGGNPPDLLQIANITQGLEHCEFNVVTSDDICTGT